MSETFIFESRINIKRYMVLAILAWTAVIGVLFSLNIYREKQQTLEFAVVQARSALNKDLTYRRWNASYGGVYVPVTEKSQPNSYLTIQNREVETMTGVQLTLINPAYMTRQVHEMGMQQYGERGHITSLDPIRPQNAADEWETEALKSFEVKPEEVRTVLSIDGVQYLRLMIPLTTEEDCLKCHGAQGYKVGDIRGGLSVSVPLTPYLESYVSNTWKTFLGYGLLWSLGVGSIFVAAHSAGRQVDEQMRIEEEIRQINANLEQRVEERTRDLGVVQEKLVRQEKLAVLGQLAAGVGHELRNPLGVISNAVYFLKIAQPGVNEKIKEYLDIVEKQVYLSDKIVNDLLGFTRIQSTNGEPVSMPVLICQTLERFRVPDGVNVETDLPANLPQAYADPQHVIQILGNLILNACQSMPHGGRLVISSRVQCDMVCVTVSDTGVGISPENMGRLFDPLFTTKPKGIGLGLAVSRGLMEANGGRIEVQSEDGKGSTFMAYFPLYREAG
jgi:signal transduction histidine kinase